MSVGSTGGQPSNQSPSYDNRALATTIERQLQQSALPVSVIKRATQYNTQVVPQVVCTSQYKPSYCGYGRLPARARYRAIARANQAYGPQKLNYSDQNQIMPSSRHLTLETNLSHKTKSIFKQRIRLPLIFFQFVCFVQFQSKNIREGRFCICSVYSHLLYYCKSERVFQLLHDVTRPTWAVILETIWKSVFTSLLIC